MPKIRQYPIFKNKKLLEINASAENKDNVE